MPVGETLNGRHWPRVYSLSLEPRVRRHGAGKIAPRPLRGLCSSPPQSALVARTPVAFTGATWYGRTMSKTQHHSNSAADQLLAEAAHLQAIEGNPLTAEEIAMFEMFQREGWSLERRRAHILRRIEDRGRVAAAE